MLAPIPCTRGGGRGTISAATSDLSHRIRGVWHGPDAVLGRGRGDDPLPLLLSGGAAGPDQVLNPREPPSLSPIQTDPRRLRHIDPRPTNLEVSIISMKPK